MFAALTSAFQARGLVLVGQEVMEALPFQKHGLSAFHEPNMSDRDKAGTVDCLWSVVEEKRLTHFCAWEEADPVYLDGRPMVAPGGTHILMAACRIEQ